MVFPLLMSPFLKKCFSHVKSSILFCAAYFSSHVDFASMFHICVASCIFGSLFLVILSGFTYFLASMHVLCVLLEPSLHDCFVLKPMTNFCLCSETQRIVFCFCCYTVSLTSVKNSETS